MLFVGVQSKSEVAAMPEKDTIRLETRFGPLEITKNVLEKLKLALQHFVDGTSLPPEFFEHRAQMRSELLESAIWIENGEAGVGVWKLAVADGHPVLVRYPLPTRGPMYIYRAAFAPDGSEWKVTSFTQERELGPEC
jgi:hypothetical protein